MDRPIKGRGALSNHAGRFARHERDPDLETLAAIEADEGVQTKLPTNLHIDSARTIIARNSSPDIPFSQSINPYKGCGHGCSYCYARTTHSYLDLSPGRDFETEIFYKPNAVELLRAELAHPRYELSPIAMGTNTDPYQPVERELRVTRGILELLLEHKHPVTIVTKGALILRDLDVLAALAAENLVAVHVSLTTLDNELKRRMEPRTAGPKQRLAMLRELSAAGVPTGVITAPIIPALNDHELEAMLEAAAAHGATSAGYVLLRLPHEVGPLFVEWLREHYPDKAEHVLSLLKQLRGGALYDSQFGSRQRGFGPLAKLLAARFANAKRRFKLDRQTTLRLDLFSPPRTARPQLDLPCSPHSLNICRLVRGFARVAAGICGTLPFVERAQTVPNHRLLIIDDDVRLAEMLVEYLTPEGIQLTSVPSGIQGLRNAQRENYDLIILDVMLPGLSGFDVLKQLREAGSKAPVLMLTARGDDVDRIVGLDLGADDYLPKPFNPRELLARIKAILRRTSEPEGEEPAELTVGDLRVNLRRREAWLGDNPLKLTNAEFVILVTLMRSPGDVVSREALTRTALGRQLLPDDRSLDTHISNLRRKLGSEADADVLIRSIRGSGYVLVPPQA